MAFARVRDTLAGQRTEDAPCYDSNAARQSSVAEAFAEVEDGSGLDDAFGTSIVRFVHSTASYTDTRTTGWAFLISILAVPANNTDWVKASLPQPSAACDASTGG